MVRASSPANGRARAIAAYLRARSGWPESADPAVSRYPWPWLPRREWRGGGVGGDGSADPTGATARPASSGPIRTRPSRNPAAARSPAVRARRQVLGDQRVLAGQAPGVQQRGHGQQRHIPPGLPGAERVQPRDHAQRHRAQRRVGGDHVPTRQRPQRPGQQHRPAAPGSVQAATATPRSRPRPSAQIGRLRDRPGMAALPRQTR